MTVTDLERETMQECIGRARKAFEESGKSGISAALIRNGEVLCEGENQVHLDHDSTRHAEIVTMARASDILGRSDLSDCTLISTLQPCEMCLTAARFAGISRIIFAAQQANVDQSKYFMFPGLTLEQFHQGSEEAFEAIGGVCEHDILDLYADGDA